MLGDKIEIFKSLPTETLYEVTVERLQEEFKRDWGKRMRFGQFRWIIHEGNFHVIEDWPKNRRYRSLHLREGRSRRAG